MKLVPTTDDDRARAAILKVVSPLVGSRGAACIDNWNQTVGRQYNITVAASH